MRRSREVRHLGSDLFEPSGSAAIAQPSNFQLVAAFQIEDFAGFVPRRDFETEAFDDLAGKLHVDQGLCEAGTDRRPDVQSARQDHFGAGDFDLRRYTNARINQARRS
jgi:hypothetical protein